MCGKPETKRELTFVQFYTFFDTESLPIYDCCRFGNADRLWRSLQFLVQKKNQHFKVHD